MDDDFNLAEYMSGEIECIVRSALKASLNNPRESAFLLRYMWESKRAKKRRDCNEKFGIHIPPFLIASITSSCNLFCKGCYARANQSCGEHLKQNELLDIRWNRIFAEAKNLGIAFILLAGGEPLMRKDVIKFAAGYKSIIFPVFTNGTMIDKEYISLFDQNRNLVPVLSIEGNREQTDQRRGEGTYDTVSEVMKQLRLKGIFCGVSITVTTENIETVASDEFMKQLFRRGCKLTFFVEYVPVTKSSKHLAPTDKERVYLETRLSKLRDVCQGMIFLAFPGDEKNTGGCLAAGRGFFHINTDGKAEPCPFSPFSDRSVKECSLLDALKSPLFTKLNQDGMLLGEHDGGCLLFEKEDEVKELLMK